MIYAASVTLLVYSGALFTHSYKSMSLSYSSKYAE